MSFDIDSLKVVFIENLNKFVELNTNTLWITYSILYLQRR